MKKIYFIVLLFSSFSGVAQDTLIPDVNFEKALIDLGIDSGTPDGRVITANISLVSSLDLSSKNISNLTGIQDFLSLTNLSCFNNQLTSLDVTKNTSLTYLSCWNNQLSSLDVTKNTSLTYLDCNDNKLTSINVTLNTGLTDLYCNDNKLTSINVTLNTSLIRLGCSSNQLTNVDVTKNISLTYLSCFSNQLTSLNVIKNTFLTYLVCSSNQLTSLYVAKNTELRELYCTSNQLTSLDVTQNTSLNSFTCWNNQLTSLDVSKNTSLILLYCDNNQLTTLDVSTNTSLINFACSNNQLISLNLKNGNNTNINTTFFNLISNLNLTCILVDNTTYSNTNWLPYKDPSARYSNSCGIITIPNNNIAPIITATGNQDYCPQPNIKIVTDITITDPDDTTTDAIYIQISSGYINGQDIIKLTGSHSTITSSWDASAGKLKLFSPTGSQVSYTDFVAAIKDVEYYNSSISPSGTRNFSISIGQANYLPSNGHYYEYISSPGISWTNAKNAAATKNYYGLQGYLTTITTADEAQLAGAQAAVNGWIGGSDEQTEGVWKWMTGPETGTVFWNGAVNGSTPTYANWNTGEPNNTNNNEHYAHVKAPGVPGIPGSWNDLQLNGDALGNYQSKGYIVEYGGMAGDPVLNIAASTTITIPKVTSTTANSRCGSGTVTLQATSSDGAINWYADAIGGTSLATANSYTTPILSTTTSYYVDAANGNCSANSRTEIIATIKPFPTITATTPGSICTAGTVVLGAIPSAGIVNWYDVATGGTILATGTTFITPSISTTTNFYTEATADGCTSLSRTAITATVNNAPTIIATAPESRCGPGSVLLDATPSSGNVKWYDVPTAGTLLFTGNSFSTPSINATTTYYAEAILNNCASSRVPVTATIYQIGTTKKEIILCQGQLTTLDASMPNMLYLWSPGGETTQTITVSAIGKYSVTISSPTAISCESKKNINVIEHLQPIITSIVVEESSIVIELENSQNYFEYSINGIDFQALNQFSYIPTGQYTAFVQENNGCNLVTQQFNIFTIPKFFTPNNDGFNDVWKIKEMGDYPNSSAQIFDRYGKLIIELNATNYSWDGKFNSKNLPADDYWYHLKLDNTKPQIRGHFTLKR